MSSFLTHHLHRRRPVAMLHSFSAHCDCATWSPLGAASVRSRGAPCGACTRVGPKQSTRRAKLVLLAHFSHPERFSSNETATCTIDWQIMRPITDCSGHQVTLRTRMRAQSRAIQVAVLLTVCLSLSTGTNQDVVSPPSGSPVASSQQPDYASKQQQEQLIDNSIAGQINHLRRFQPPDVVASSSPDKPGVSGE